MSLRDFIQRNFWLKLFSLVLAAMIWFTIYTFQRVPVAGRADTVEMGQRTFERHPITVMHSASEVRAFQVFPSEVNVTVLGSGPALQRLTPRDLEVFVNLTEVQESGGFARKVQVFVPDGVEVLRVSPPMVRIEQIPTVPLSPNP